MSTSIRCANAAEMGERTRVGFRIRLYNAGNRAERCEEVGLSQVAYLGASAFNFLSEC